VQFIEDTGDVLFYKNARGVAAYAAVPADHSQSDSGVDVSADKN
jgi:omega-6 fatty acid desaturase (delta-12 desaturase)